MKITKGMKLTEDQKAQRAESRRRNQEYWMRINEEFQRRQAAEDKLRAARINADLARLAAETAQVKLLEAEGRRFVINITAEERQALFEISRIKLVEQHPAIQLAAGWAMKFALCHSDQLLNWATGLIRYEKAEGINQIDFVNSKIEMEAKRLAKERI